jgi:hypothetical protein
MRRVLCVPIHCRCGERAVWSAEVDWLEREGLEVARFMHPGLAPKRLAIPPEAADVTGKFNLRCARCFELMPVFAIMRSRVAAGVGVVVELPTPRGAAAVATRSDPPVAVPAKGTRLTGKEGRRARRIHGVTGMPARASVMFDLTVMDMSIVGLSAEHAHAVRVGNLYTLYLRLSNQPTAVRVNARAVWTTSSRIDQRRGARQTTFRSGFEFVDLDMETASALDGYVRERMSL